MTAVELLTATGNFFTPPNNDDAAHAAQILRHNATTVVAVHSTTVPGSVLPGVVMPTNSLIGDLVEIHMVLNNAIVYFQSTDTVDGVGAMAPATHPLFNIGARLVVRKVSATDWRTIVQG